MKQYFLIRQFIRDLFSAESSNNEQNRQLEYITYRQESKLARLEEYLKEDENQGISNLALYLYGR